MSGQENNLPGEKFRLLILEDNPDDAELCIRELKRAGLQLDTLLVDNETDFRAALRPELDLIIADYSLPEIDAPRALDILKEEGLHPRVPFLIVTGAVGEERAVEVMRAGASDYVLKDRMARLGQAALLCIERGRIEREYWAALHAVRASEERFRALAENIHEVIWLTDRSRQVVHYVNPAYEEVWGRKTADLLADPTQWLESIHPDDRESVLNELPGQLDGTFNIDYRIVRPDGTIRWINHRAAPVAGENGVERIAGVAMDITGRKEAQSRAERSADWLREMVESMPVGILIANRHGIIIQTNTALQSTFGYSREDLIGAHIGILLPQELRDAHHGMFEMYIKNPEARNMGAGRDLIGVHRDGRRIPIEVGLTPMDDGEPLVLATLLDISRRRRAEEAMQERGRQLAQTQALAHVGGWEADMSNGSVSWTDEMYRIVGLEPGTPPPKFEDYLRDYLPPDDAMDLKQRAERSRETGRGFEMDHRIIRRDGATRHVHLRVEPVQDSDGQVILMRGTTQDTTAHRKLEAQLLQSQKLEAIGRLSGGIAHDFNNLLTVILGHMTMLEEERDSMTEDARDSLQSVRRAAERASTLTYQLLLFSRNEVPRIERIDLNGVVRETAQMLERTLGEDVQLKLQTLAEPAYVDADSGMLTQVIMNLAVNARDAMPSGGEILIETERRSFDKESAEGQAHARAGDFWCLAVTDTGEGISALVQSRIFDPFFTTKDVGQGTGLGLSTVLGIVQQHSGWLNVYSEVGQGASFRVYLPVSSRASGAQTAATSEARPAGGSERLLIVEDEGPIRALLESYLERKGYTVVTAADGQEALRIFRAGGASFDLAMCDLIMPGGMNGLDLAQQLTAEAPRLVTIFASGYPSVRVGNAITLVAGHNFLPKPFSLPEVAALIRKRLDERAFLGKE